MSDDEDPTFEGLPTWLTSLASTAHQPPQLDALDWGSALEDVLAQPPQWASPADLTVESVLRAMDDIGRRTSFPCGECGYEGSMYRLMETETTVLYRERCGCGERVRKYPRVTAPARR
jgi:hypothetical protein